MAGSARRAGVGFDRQDKANNRYKSPILGQNLWRMKPIKRFFKRNSHNWLFKNLAGFGRSLNRFYENRNHDISSNGELTVIRKIAGFQPSVLIDAGANVGKYSLALARYCPQATIYALEPVERTFLELQANLAPYPNIIPVKKGLYFEAVAKEINVYPSHTHSSLYDIEGLSYQPSSRQTIELISGDEFARENQIENIDFLKLDLEGAEYDALLGFQDLLRKKRIKAIQFEYGYINISTKKLLIDFYHFFEEYGYILGKIFPKEVEFREYAFKYEDFIGPNFLAVNKDEPALIEALRKK